MTQKRIFTALLVICMLFACLPFGAEATVPPDSVHASRSSSNGSLGTKSVSPTLYYGRRALSAMDDAETLLFAYDNIVQGVENQQEWINVYNGSTYLSVEQITAVMDAYTRDCTGQFWLSNGWGYSYISAGVLDVRVGYCFTESQLSSAQAAFDSAVSGILSGITPSMSDYDKALYLHDTLASRVAYVDAAHAHNAYGALVEGQAVCEGYAEAYQYLLQQAGIQSFIITGSSRGIGHAWNAIKIDGQFYHVDVTWDDQEEEIYHAYFNLTDARIREDHVLDTLSFALPVCNSEKAFYFTGKETLMDTYTTAKVGLLLNKNGGEVHVYVPGDVDAFLDWYDANIWTIAAEGRLQGGFSYGYRQLGREIVLILDGEYQTYIPVTGVQFRDPTISISQGTTVKFFYTVSPENATNKNITITSSDPDVVTMDPVTGFVTGHSIGTAELTITTEDGSFTDTCLVLVICEHTTRKQVADEAHLVPGTGENCQSYKQYYPECISCGQIVTYPLYIWTAYEYGDHDLSAELTTVDGTHYRHCTVEGCGYSEPADHVLAEEWTTADGSHFRLCTVAGCTYRGETTQCSGGTPSCYEKAVCHICGAEYGEYLSHSYGTGWAFTDETGHAQVCTTPGCGHVGQLYPHTANIPLPTETEDQLCTVCGYVLAYRGSHICADNLTFHAQVSATCTSTGIRAYYECICGSRYADPAAAELLTDVVLPMTEHTMSDATCAAPRTCSVCGTTDGAPDPTAHKKDGDTCAYCGAGVCGENVFWKLEDGVLTVSGTGAMDNFATVYDTPWKDLHSKIRTVRVTEGVTSIGSRAFSGCYELQTLSLPIGLDSIREQAFSGCKNLTELEIPEGVTSIGSDAFSNCGAVQTVKLPQSLEHIGSGAFGNLTALEAIEIPEAVQVISAYAFQGCESLEKIVFRGDAPVFKDLVFLNVTATAFYPRDNATWTAAVMQDYGGNLTWKRECIFPEHQYSLTEVTPPTCLEQGYTTYICECGESYTGAFVPAAGHIPEPIPAVPPTCSSPGLSEGSKCSVCGDVLVHRETVPAAGHKPNIPAPTETEDQICVECGMLLAGKLGHSCAGNLTLYMAVDPTCTAAGSISYYGCTCGNKYEDPEATRPLTDVTVPALGHSPSTVAGYAPTCTAAGKTDGSYCARCSSVLTEQSAIPALGHAPVTDEAVAPTCTTSGKSEGSHCDRCGEVFTAQQILPAAGHTPETVPGKAPTCTSTGLTEGETCAVCGEVLTAQELIDAVGHEPVIDEAQAPTCQTTGLTEGKTCAVCGEILIPQTVLPKLEHTEQTLPGKAPTCTEAGLSEGKSCSVCGQTVVAQQVLPAVGHTPEAVPGKAPTCTETGLTEGSRCGSCGTTLTSQETLSALGHTEDILAAVAPGCTVPGLTEGKQCSVCGTVTAEQTPIPAAGHSWENGICSRCEAVCEHIYSESGSCINCGYGCSHDYSAAVTAPTCTAQGFTAYTCLTCGHTYNGDYVSALGHTWQDATCTAPKTCAACGITDGGPNDHSYATAVTAPTCTAQGFTTHTCTACGDSYADTYTDPVGHIPAVPVEENRVDPTCTEAGSYETVTGCAVCGQELSRIPGTIPAAGHSYTDAVTAPTCTEQGYTTHTCHCGDSFTDSHTPAAGHSYGPWQTVTAPTCTEEGQKQQTCAACGHMLTEPLPAAGHSWQTVDAVTMECAVCGQIQSGYRIEVEIGEDTGLVAYVDGRQYPITVEGTKAFVSVLHTDASNLVIHTLNDPYAADVHTQYPTGMRVWLLEFADGSYKATNVPEFDNLLQYSGCSIRIVGVKGIRMITSLDKDTRAALINGGLAGYTLVEYGTALAWASDLSDGSPLVLGTEYTKSNFAYRRKEADPIFARPGNLIQYTNVLVGFDNDQCIPDIVMRPYIILEDGEGQQITLYGGEVTRSIGYIAYQNRTSFSPGNAAYDYVWSIIHHVYGDQYDEEFNS